MVRRRWTVEETSTWASCRFAHAVFFFIIIQFPEIYYKPLKFYKTHLGKDLKEDDLFFVLLF